MIQMRKYTVYNAVRTGARGAAALHPPPIPLPRASGDTLCELNYAQARDACAAFSEIPSDMHALVAWLRMTEHGARDCVIFSSVWLVWC
jgi:hypothetical protein